MRLFSAKKQPSAPRSEIAPLPPKAALNGGLKTFDQPVILQRSPLFSRAVVWSIMGFTAFTLVWASVTRLDEAIPATGKLSPQGAVRDVQVPLNGKVKDVLVKEGQQVKQGDRLLTLDQTAAIAQQASLTQIRTALVAENQLYRSVLAGESGVETNPAIAKLPTALADITKSRTLLQAENQLYRAQLGTAESGTLNSEQALRLQSSQTERDSRQQAAQLEVEQLQQQLAQMESRLRNAQSTLKINQGIFTDLAAVAEAGGIAKVQYLRQQQEVMNSQAQVEQFQQEAERLRLAIAQAQQRLQNTMALSSQDTLTKIAANDQKIADIDSQLNKLILENDKKIAELDSQLSQTKLTLQYQELTAPVDGVVFDLKAAHPGFVATTNEPVMKIVPDNALMVEVYITNKDIGFIKPGMPVDVRVDSFPFNEFGDIKGEVVSVGSDALPATQQRPYESFSTRIKLNQQSLAQGSLSQTSLQSGMSVSVNIKVRDRTILSIFTDGFSQQADALKTVR
jgi:hemolysin D